MELLSQDCDSPLQRGLRWLTAVAAAVIFAGGVVLLVRQGGAATRFRVFHGEPLRLRAVLGGAVHGDARAMIMCGVLLLIAVPFLRVLFAGVGYRRERDWLYVAVSAVVLAVLVGSLLGHL